MMPVGRLEGKVAIVTGAGSELGRAAGHRFEAQVPWAGSGAAGSSIIIPTRLTRTTTSSRWL